MDRRNPILVPRRVVLLGAAGAALLTACGGDDAANGDTTAAGGTTPTAGGTTPSGDGARSLVAMFNAAGPFLVTGHEQRAPFTVGDAQGLPDPDAVPDELALALVRAEDDRAVRAPVTVPVHRDGVPVPYYPYRFTVDEPGSYIVRGRVDGQEISAAIAVVIPDEVTHPLVGAALPSVATPTVDDARGVDPICTRVPPCDLHATSLDKILTAGRPVAVLVATPMFCQTAMCGPTLDLLVDVAGDHPGLDVVHVEVYRSSAEVEEGEPVIAPAVEGLGLDFEPVLFVVDGTGTVVSSLVSIMDRGELEEALALVAT